MACPYAKKYSRASAKWQPYSPSCLHPFPSFARLKGHLHRSHTVPHRCPRCQETFRDAETLKRHQKAIQACEVRRQEDDRILTSDQEEFLKKRSTGKKPDEQKWKDLYANFFPEDKESDVPSPFWNNDILADYHEHIRRKFRAALLAKLDLFGLDSRMKNMLIEVAEDVNESLFCAFQQQQCESSNGTASECSGKSSSEPNEAMMDTPASSTESEFIDADTSNLIETWNEETFESAPLSPVLEHPQSPNALGTHMGSSSARGTTTAVPQAGYSGSPSSGNTRTPLRRPSAVERNNQSAARASLEANPFSMNPASAQGSENHTFATFPYGTMPVQQVHSSSGNMGANLNMHQVPTMQYPFRHDHGSTGGFAPLQYPPSFLAPTGQHHFIQQYIDPSLLQSQYQQPSSLVQDQHGRAVTLEATSSPSGQISDAQMTDLPGWMGIVDNADG